MHDAQTRRALRLRTAQTALAPALALALALTLLTGCPTPVGVRPMEAAGVHRQLTRSVLSSEQPSPFSEQVLHRMALYERFQRAPVPVLDRLHAELPPTGSVDLLFALAELSFLHAKRSGDRSYYLASAVYAYAFLFPQGAAELPGHLDPRLRLAADLYNRGLTEGLAGEIETEVEVSAGTKPLPFGRLEMGFDPDDLRWGSYRMTGFFAVAQLDVVGLRNRYRRPGIGAPLAADLVAVNGRNGQKAPAAFRSVPADVKVAVTAFLRIPRPRLQIAEGHVKGQLELYTSEDVDTITTAGGTLPLEYESSSSLAFTLGEASFAGFDLAGFFSGRLGGDAKRGLLMLRPYRRGRIPVVLVHGTASSPSWWANMLNELHNDSELHDRFQFWLYRYATSSPMLYSAGLLRQALRDTVKEIDPDGSDPALQRMVLIGHSQGGLLAKLSVVDSGDVFWKELSDRPFDSYDLDPESREVLERTLFVKPVASVTRVIYMATPHGGSFLARAGLADFMIRFISLPVELATLPLQLLEDDAERLADAIADTPTSLHGLTPGSRFLEDLASLEVAEGVSTHSIIAVAGDGAVEDGDDGVVKYTSAHVDGVDSELVVRSSHSVQLAPLAIEEVARILREHIASTAAGAP